MNSKTAVLIFANSSKVERKFKSFAKGNALIDEINKNTLKTVKKTKLPYFIFTEKEQKGASFGERFTNALQAVFNEGFNRVITIGNDTPQLKKQHLLKAADAIANANFVIGPSLDGGFYLMGLTKKQFEKVDFLHLPWQKNTLEKSLSLQMTNADEEIIKLNSLLDVDADADLKALFQFRTSISKKLIALLSTLFLQNISIQFFSKLQVRLLFNRNYYNKGSPIIVLS